MLENVDLFRLIPYIALSGGRKKKSTLSEIITDSLINIFQNVKHIQYVSSAEMNSPNERKKMGNRLRYLTLIHEFVIWI